MSWALSRESRFRGLVSLFENVCLEPPVQLVINCMTCILLLIWHVLSLQSMCLAQLTTTCVPSACCPSGCRTWRWWRTESCHHSSKCQKSPSKCQKSPSKCQKSPSKCQKRPSEELRAAIIHIITSFAAIIHIITSFPKSHSPSTFTEQNHYTKQNHWCPAGYRTWSSSADQKLRAGTNSQKLLSWPVHVLYKGHYISLFSCTKDTI